MKYPARYYIWKLLNPRGDFGDYYVSSIERQLDRGGAHPTLGGRRKDAGTFETSGRLLVDWLVSDGLQPSDRLVDFGCGSLRLGRHFLTYLQAGHYIAMDLSDRFYQEGLAQLPEDLVGASRPRFFLIDDANLVTVAAERPEVVVSFAVLIHIPLDGVSEYFGRIARLLPPGGRAYVSFQDGPEFRRRAGMSFVHPVAELTARAGACGMSTEVFPDPQQQLPGRKPDAAFQKVLRLTRVESARA
ncbi:MAG: class I SAM-dependent methyltransferase [Acidobacteria bacterium]|nr:class I SAM-dependent methyltransferase [Acidobacteriota bacterium]